MFDFTITLRLPPEFFSAVDRLVTAINTKGNEIMASTKEVRDLAVAVKQKVDAFQPAIDTTEARITALIKQIGTMTPEQQQELDEAFGVLTAAATGADTALTDLTDGADEGEAPPTP